jgi:hypothetical protein
MLYFHLVVLAVLLALEAGLKWCPHAEAVAAMGPVRNVVLVLALGVSVRDLFTRRKD